MEYFLTASVNEKVKNRAKGGKSFETADDYVERERERKRREKKRQVKEKERKEESARKERERKGEKRRERERERGGRDIMSFEEI